jgi:hypothetical protein
MSRKLEKPEFIKLLKEVSDKLDEESIRNEIPFVYKDKHTFDFIKILIPQETDATLLEDIFKSNQYTVSGRFIDFYYKDFRFIFIRTAETEFFPTFFYYSWDIVPTLLNVMLNKMGLDLCPSGLRYVAGEKSFMISNNIKFILEYLGLDFEDYMRKGFKSLFDEVSFVSTSSYFNVKIFKEFQLNPRDFFFFEHEPQYKYALSLFDNFDAIRFEGYDYDQELDSYLLNIDLMFPGSNFLENVAKLKFVK